MKSGSGGELIGAATIRSLFVHRDAIARHLSAPRLIERDAYIESLQRAGFSRRFLAERASCLIWVDVSVERRPDGMVSEAEIANASAIWSEQRDVKQATTFKATARSWFSFLGIYAKVAKGGHYGEALRAFAVQSANSLPPVSAFLEWISPRRTKLHSVTALDVQDYLSWRQQAGLSARSVSNIASTLRSFFRFAERKGWSSAKLSQRIDAPSVKKRQDRPRCPSWSQVRRMLHALNVSDPSHCRAKAILLMAAVYGLRRAELARLTLDDFDWRNEVLTVRRAKRGRLQQFPLVPEIGEAILDYLRMVRPPSRYRNLFLTLHRPHRPAINLGPSMRKVMNRQGAFGREWGLHALRHACATELLRQATPLREIADFLGHRNLDSVSVYAHCDLVALERVAELDLSDVL